MLIDLQHGSIRYRYLDDDGKSKKKEHPHEGDEKQNKGHYFYHPRLSDFGESKCNLNDYNNNYNLIIFIQFSLLCIKSYVL